MNAEIIINWLPIILSAAAFVFSVWQFFFERNRNRKEATIYAFDKLEESEAVLFLFEVKKPEIDTLVRWRTNLNSTKGLTGKKAEEWELLSKALPLIEHFAVGINSKVYDLKTLNSMAGNQLIRTWDNCEELIEHKRNGADKKKNYSEFEKMVNSLVKLRNKNKQYIAAGVTRE